MFQSFLRRKLPHSIKVIEVISIFHILILLSLFAPNCYLNFEMIEMMNFKSENNR